MTNILLVWCQKYNFFVIFYLGYVFIYLFIYLFDNAYSTDCKLVKNIIHYKQYALAYLGKKAKLKSLKQVCNF